MFTFRFPSLRDFCLSARTDEFLINLGDCFKIQGVPSDDGFRYILSRLEAGQINWILKNMNEAIRTRKILKDQFVLNEYELVVMDGSGHLASSKVHHDCCLIRKYDTLLNDDSDRKLIYMHHELVLALTNKFARYTIPILYEPIRNATISHTSIKRPSPKTNLLEYEEISPEGELLCKNAWITDLPLDETAVVELARAGRARFSIENRVFNVLKNHGFNIEHNYGHAGNLPEIFFGLALIALVITQMYILWTGVHPKIRASGSIARHFKNLQVLITQTILKIENNMPSYLKFNLVDKINYNTS